MRLIPKESQETTPIGNASVGDIVTVHLELTPENGFVPESLFDRSGEISFVLGWGNYLPGLHELIQGMSVGEECQGASIDAGWGTRKQDLILTVPKANFKKMKTMENVQPGVVLNLKGGIQVSVLQVTDDTVIVDANPPLAGSSYSCSLKVSNVERFPTSKLQYHETTTTIVGDNYCQNNARRIPSSPYEVATWAMGCFWGGELAFMRVPGVVGTKVGYTQGLKANPSYEEVCQGDTMHREAIMVIYDPRVVSYHKLVHVFMDRLKATVSQYQLNLFEEEGEEEDASSTLQYQHGIYYHNPEQKTIAEKTIGESHHHKYNIELKKVSVFYDAEEYHQQYLLKGGQDARKGAKETIRCYG